MTKTIYESLDGVIIEGEVLVTFNYSSEVKQSKHPDFEDIRTRVSYHKVEGKIGGKVIDACLKITTNDVVLKQITIIEDKLRAELKARLRGSNEPTIQQRLKELGFK